MPPTLRRTTAARATRREALHVGAPDRACDLAVDPAVAERLLERLVIAQAGRLGRALLGQHEPDPGVEHGVRCAHSHSRQRHASVGEPISSGAGGCDIRCSLPGASLAAPADSRAEADARGGTRTRTPFRAAVFKTAGCTASPTRARSAIVAAGRPVLSGDEVGNRAQYGRNLGRATVSEQPSQD